MPGTLIGTSIVRSVQPSLASIMITSLGFPGVFGHDQPINWVRGLLDADYYPNTNFNVNTMNTMDDGGFSKTLVLGV